MIKEKSNPDEKFDAGLECVLDVKLHMVSRTFHNYVEEAGYR